MYEIQVSTRRVTQYILEEARKWLYQRIIAGEYNAEGCKDGKALILKIEEEQQVSEVNYARFATLMEESPFEYMMVRGKRKTQKITSDLLFNYFVRYNDEILPLGFVKDFFEDDYETKQQVGALLSDFAAERKSKIKINWRRELTDKEEALDNVRSKCPTMFKPHPMLVITQAIRFAVVIAQICFLTLFVKGVQLFDVVKAWVSDVGFDMSAKITSGWKISAFCLNDEVFCNPGDTFSMQEYIAYYLFFFLLALLVIVLFIMNLKKAVSFLIFAIRLIVNNVRLWLQKLYIRVFEKNGVDKIDAYFSEIIPDLSASGRVEDSQCKGIPGIKHLYNSVKRFDAKKYVEKLQVYNNKYMSKSYTYEPNQLPAVKRRWRKRLIIKVIFALVTAVLLVPGIYGKIVPVFAKIFGSL